MLTQLPRLTNSLRDHFDVDRAYLQRKEVLRNIKSSRSRDDLELARRLVQRWDDVSSDVRQAYKEFLGSVRELTDGEFSSAEFQEVAIFMYSLFSVPDIDIKRRIFEKKFLPVMRRFLKLLLEVSAYLVLNDLYDPYSASSASYNSCITVNYYDSEELWRYIGSTTSNQSLPEEHIYLQSLLPSSRRRTSARESAKVSSQDRVSTAAPRTS